MNSLATMEISAKLHKIAREAGYMLEHRPIIHKRGWPDKSARPYHLLYSDGSHLAAYASRQALENALRARAGC